MKLKLYFLCLSMLILDLFMNWLSLCQLQLICDNSVVFGSKMFCSLYQCCSYTASQKNRHYTFGHNFAKCLLIFNILSLADSLENLW